MKIKPTLRLFAIVALAFSLLASSGRTDEPMVGLVIKTDTNPFFVRMKEAAIEKADELGAVLRTFTGTYDGDTQAQVEAVEAPIAAGVAGILIAPSDPVVLADVVRKAREAGVLVIALGTPFDPADTAHATFATDNFRVGELIGSWARARLGDAAESARIVTLDGSGAHVTVEILRNQGFLAGFGIDIQNSGKMYDEDDVRIVGHGATNGLEEGGRDAMEKLLRKTSEIDVVYAINEPAAAGAYAALKAFGRAKDVLIVSVDGGCQGIGMIAAGTLSATAMQYPVKMAVLGVEAVVGYVRTGKMTESTLSQDFHDTGVTLVTEEPVAGIPSISTQSGLKECWV